MNASSTDKNRVLIVDDEPGNIKILSSVLAGDYALSVATGGAQALQIAEVQGMEGDVIVMQEVFTFEQTGVVDGQIQHQKARNQYLADNIKILDAQVAEIRELQKEVERRDQVIGELVKAVAVA